MIPRNKTGNQIRHQITKPDDLLEQLQLSSTQLKLSEEANTQFQLKAPSAWLNKIQPGTPDDPLLKQIAPIDKELSLMPHYEPDPLAEAESVTQPGLLQKYHGRALLLVTPSCVINCRYCFRRHYPYDDKGHSWSQIEDNIKLLKTDESINEIILSGGDPLSLADHKFAKLVRQLSEIPHLQRLRIHTRVPVAAPESITSIVLEALKNTHLTTVIVLHINHAQEIGEDNQRLFKQFIEHGITLLNQSVLLKDVNDDVVTLTELSETLIIHGIVPYYLHMLDKVQGSAHFEVTEDKAKIIFQQLRDALPGYLVPRLVREIPGKKSKLPLLI